jgi:hypothetical protein
MPTRTLITGGDAADDLQGGLGADLIYGYDPAAATLNSISAVRVGTGFDQPLFMASPPDNPTKLYVVEKSGEIRILDTATGAVAEQSFLDVSVRSRQPASRASWGWPSLRISRRAGNSTSTS